MKSNTYKIPMKTNLDLIQFPEEENLSKQKQQIRKKKSKKSKITQNQNNEQEYQSQQQKKPRTIVKIISMKNIEVLVIGAAKVGKTSFIQKLLSEEEKSADDYSNQLNLDQHTTLMQNIQNNHHENHLEIINKEEQIDTSLTPEILSQLDIQNKKEELSQQKTNGHQYVCGVGMEIFKKEQMHKNGETVRLCIWDPTLTMIPKERLTMKRNKQAAEQKEQQGFFSNLFGLGKSKKNESQNKLAQNSTEMKSIGNQQDSEPKQKVLPFIKEFQKDTNLELAHEYIQSGTYHVAIFMFDLTNFATFQEMEEWFDFFREHCHKSSKTANFTIIGTKSDLISTINQENSNKSHSVISKDQQNTQISTLPRQVDLGTINEWIKDIQEELDHTNQRVQYFEISSLNNDDKSKQKQQTQNKTQFKRIREWVIESGLEKYDYIERNRFRNSIENTQDKKRECNVDCSIF
eukprot:403338563